MLLFIIDYFSFIKENVYNNKRGTVIILYIIIPVFITGLILSFNDLKQVHTFFISTSQELINMFALTSGFLFTSVALILNSTSEIGDIKITKISDKLDMTKSETLSFIGSLKKTLFYDIVFQFLMTLICILSIAILKGITEGFLVLFLSVISIYCSCIVIWGIITLLKNFSLYHKNIAFEE